MTGINHGITGAAIALIVKEPILAIPLAFFSHFITDMIPHFGLDEKEIFGRRFNFILIADFISAVVLMAVLAILFPDNFWLIWACMIAAASPDLMWGYHRLYVVYLKKKPQKYGFIAKFHHKIQWSQSLPGLYVETLWFLLVGTYILLLR